MKKIFSIYLLLITTLLVFDQITKVFFTSRDFFIWVMHFHLVKNYGLSFGIHTGRFNLIVVVVALILLAIYIPKNLFSKFNWGIVFLGSGAISNLIDRITLGYVRDFWDLGLGFAFNLADVFILVGLAMLLFSSNQEQAVE